MKLVEVFRSLYGDRSGYHFWAPFVELHNVILQCTVLCLDKFKGAARKD